MDDEQLQETINAVGAVAELLSLMRNALLRNGFSEDQMLYILGIYLECIMP